MSTDHHRDPIDDDVPDGALFVPARATMALDLRELYGPAVDTACGTFEGNPAGDVDAWEIGTATPTRDQVRRLAALTDLPVRFFFEPIEDFERGDMFVCRRSGPKGMGRQICERVPMIPIPPAAEHVGHQQGALF